MPLICRSMPIEHHPRGRLRGNGISVIHKRRGCAEPIGHRPKTVRTHPNPRPNERALGFTGGKTALPRCAFLRSNPLLRHRSRNGDGLKVTLQKVDPGSSFITPFKSPSRATVSLGRVQAGRSFPIRPGNGTSGLVGDRSRANPPPMVSTSPPGKGYPQHAAVHKIRDPSCLRVPLQRRFKWN